MPITTTLDLTDTTPTVLEEARFTEQFMSVLAPLCWRITKTLHDGKTVNVPYFGTVTAGALVEGVDMVSPQTMKDTLVTITPAEVGAQILITKKAIRDNQEDIIRAAGRILGSAMAVKRDQDIWAQLDDATNSLGSTTTTLTLGAVAAARAILGGNPVSSGGPAPKPYAMVHHPYTLLDIVDVFTPLSPAAASAGIATDMGNETLRNYLVGRLFGMPVYEDGNTDPVSNALKGGIFATGQGGALILATALEWEVNPQVDESRRAVEYNVVGEYGVGEYLAGWIVELSNDATLPA